MEGAVSCHTTASLLPLPHCDQAPNTDIQGEKEGVLAGSSCLTLRSGYQGHLPQCGKGGRLEVMVLREEGGQSGGNKKRLHFFKRHSSCLPTPCLVSIRFIACRFCSWVCLPGVGGGCEARPPSALGCLDQAPSFSLVLLSVGAHSAGRTSGDGTPPRRWRWRSLPIYPPDRSIFSCVLQELSEQEM